MLFFFWAFKIQNETEATVDLPILSKYTGPMSNIVLGGVLVGALIMFLLLIVHFFKRNKELLEAKLRIKELERKLEAELLKTKEFQQLLAESEQINPDDL